MNVISDEVLISSAEFFEGIQLFNKRQWWEAHEAWEPAWQQAASLDRIFLQALILMAAALHKRWYHGSLADRNYFKAERYLEQLPDVYAGVNLVQLRQDVWAGLYDANAKVIIAIAGG